MEKRIRFPRHWLLSLVSRLSIVALAVLVLCGVFFILGGVQKFTENTQLFLLRMVKFSSLCFSILMVFNFISIIYHGIAGAGFKYGRLILVLFGLALGTSGYVLSVFLKDLIASFG